MRTTLLEPWQRTCQICFKTLGTQAPLTATTAFVRCVCKSWDQDDDRSCPVCQRPDSSKDTPQVNRWRVFWKDSRQRKYRDEPWIKWISNCKNAKTLRRPTCWWRNTQRWAETTQTVSKQKKSIPLSSIRNHYVIYRSYVQRSSVHWFRRRSRQSLSIFISSWEWKKRLDWLQWGRKLRGRGY